MENNSQQIAHLQRLKPYQRIQIGFELYDFARSRITAVIKQQEPSLNDQELVDKVNERFRQ